MHVFYKCPQREPRELHCSLGGVFFFSLLRKDEEKSRKEIRTKEKRILLPIFISIIQTWENEAPTVPGASSTRNYFENTMKQLPLPKAKLRRESPGRHGCRADMAAGLLHDDWIKAAPLFSREENGSENFLFHFHVEFVCDVWRQTAACCVSVAIAMQRLFNLFHNFYPLLLL